MNLILCGYKASGKTTIASAFGKKYNFKVLDTDAILSECFYKMHGQQLTVPEIYAVLGEQKFRALEFSVLQGLQLNHKTIVACGGGTVIKFENLALLKQLGKIVYVFASKEDLKHRLEKLEVKCFSDIGTYLHSRDDIYQIAADLILDTSNKSIAELLPTLYQYWSKYGI